MGSTPVVMVGDIALHQSFDPVTTFWVLQPLELNKLGEILPVTAVLLSGYSEFIEEKKSWSRPNAADIAQACDRCWIHHALQTNENDLLLGIQELLGVPFVRIRETGDVWVSHRQEGNDGTWLSPDHLNTIADALRHGNKSMRWLSSSVLAE